MSKPGSLRQRDFLHVLDGGKSTAKSKTGAPPAKSKTGKAPTKPKTGKARSKTKTRRPRRKAGLWTRFGGCLTAWTGRRLQGLRRVWRSKPLRRRLSGSRNYLILLGFVGFAGLLAVGSHQLIQARVADSVERVLAVGAAIQAGQGRTLSASELRNPWSHEPIRVIDRTVELAEVNGPGCVAIVRQTLGRFRAVTVNGRLLSSAEEARLACAHEANTLGFAVGL